MNKNIRSLFFYCFFIVASLHSSAQVITEPAVIKDSSQAIISSVKIFGNKRTKNYIILREMQFKAGDTLSVNELPKNFVQARNQIYNTNLFTDVKLDSVLLANFTLQVNVYVTEKWYIYPTPQFQLADRSFNEWIKVYNADLKRVVYGVKFAHYNFTGRRDQLKVYLLNGYARNIAVSYSAPYSNPALTEGFGFSAGFTQNREVGYKTSYYNKIFNYRRDGFVRNAFNASVIYSRRKGFFRSTSVGLGFNYINADDSLLTSKYNPHYFNSAKRYQIFPDISFGISYANTDNNNYPLKGLIWSMGISKRGLKLKGDINNTTLQGGFAKFYTHKNNWYSAIQSSAIIKFPFEQAYINQRAIGYGSLTLRGLEYYVIDGIAAAVAKYTLSKKIISFKIPVPFRIKSLPVIPVKIFAKTYADVGYSYIQKQYDTRLNNRLLYTGGFGLDVLTLYDIVFKVEYSFNQLGEKGLFLHGKGGF